MRFFAGLIAALALASCATAPSAPARFAFIALNVADVDASAAWYARTFDVRELNRATGEGYDVRVLGNEAILVELIELNPAPAARPDPVMGISKAGLEIADWDARIAAWRAQGVRLFNDRVMFDETLQLHNAILIDPDGNMIQVFARPD